MKDTQIILEIIKELRAEASLNYKKEVLARYSDYEPFKEFLIRVYNPRINYYMKKIPDVSKYETEPFKEQDMSGLRDTLNVLSGRLATGDTAINYVRNFLLEANQVIKELFELVIGRDIRAGVGIGIINEVYKGLVEEIFYCRCSKLDEKALERFNTIPDGFLAQDKADGVFSYIIKANDTVTMLTRAGTAWISDSLKKDMIECSDGVYIGEALIYKDGKPLDRKTGNGLINKFIKREATLESLQEKLSQETSRKKWDKLQSELKFKLLDADLLCVDVEEGSGKYKGKVGALVLGTSCGRLRVKVGTGLNDLDRAKPFDFYIGKVIEIQYNEFIKSKSKNTDSLFLPRFVEVREDKNTATSYEEIVV